MDGHLNDDTESPPSSPSSYSAYDDEKVLQWIKSIHENAASGNLQLVETALSDLSRFAAIYYDYGYNRETLYYAELLTPQLTSRLRELFFYPETNESVTRVMDSLIPENHKRVADYDFVSKLCQMVAYRPVDSGIIQTVTLITYKLVLYGDADLKTEFLEQKLMQNMSVFVNEFLHLATADADPVITDAMIHILRAAGELIPVAETVCPSESWLLYNILKRFISCPNYNLVRELLNMMDIRCFDGQHIEFINRQDLMASLLWTLKQRRDWCYEHCDILLRIVRIIQSLLRYGQETRDAILADIRRTWTVETFCDFLIKDHPNREPSVVEAAITILEFLPAPEVAPMNLMPHIVSFMRTCILSDCKYSTCRRLEIILKTIHPIVRTFISSLSENSSGIRAVEDIVPLISVLLSHFADDDGLMLQCLVIINDFLFSPNLQVRDFVVCFLMSNQALKQIVAVGESEKCRATSQHIVNHIEKQSTAVPAGDILLLMDRMRLG